ncbi:UDP-N-acetylglucosamine transferase subunit ALG13 [Alteromonadaceae bacterium Bs31]|nr:UDP-N-acetylglucosamine transferase subunit ALG13 [Alteromonadaceae bacterium Bs31]
MIFLTTGTQLPFDRLVEALDRWAEVNKECPVFGQIGPGSYKPRHFTFTQWLSPSEYAEHFSKARIVVSHVGMGTIISGLEAGKPLVLMPRLASLGEHRNDHQLGSAEKFSHHASIDIVQDHAALCEKLSIRRQQLESSGVESVSLETSPQLIEKIQQFIEGS